MSDSPQADLITALLRAVPYPQHITALDLTSEPNAVRFTWRGDQFRVDCSTMRAEEVGDGFLSGSNKAILLGALIARSTLDTSITNSAANYLVEAAQA